MKDAPRLQVSATLDARAAYLTRAYSDLIEDTERLSGTDANHDFSIELEELNGGDIERAAQEIFRKLS